MADDLKLRRQIAEAEDAADLLANERFSSTMARIKKNCISAWINSQDGETEKREQMWARAKAIELIEGDLKQAIRDGDAARMQLEAAQADKETG